MSPVETDPRLLERMRAEWDERARENARFFIATSNEAWTDEEFFESGRENVREEILTDMENICQGKDPRQMKVVEIGCGAGRITRGLAEVFGDVYGVDVSGVMIGQGKEGLSDVPNAHIFQNNGTDLTVLNSVLGDGEADFAFSYIVFQHIPSHEVIYNYVREVRRLLRSGGLFKFQVQGSTADLEPPAAETTEASVLKAVPVAPSTAAEPHPAAVPDIADHEQVVRTDELATDTWRGVHFTDAEAARMADECGFEARYRIGAGSQYFWLWFFKK